MIREVLAVKLVAVETKNSKEQHELFDTATTVVDTLFRSALGYLLDHEMSSSIKLVLLN